MSFSKRIFLICVSALVMPSVVYASVALPNTKIKTDSSAMSNKKAFIQDQNQEKINKDNLDAKVLVRNITFEHHNVLSKQIENKLNFKFAELINTNISLNEIYKIVFETNDFLRDYGYPCATAYIPEQIIQNGNLIINIECGKYGNIILENNSDIKNGTIEKFLSHIKKGEVIKTRELEKVIYNINDIGSVTANGIFRPGANIGETDVVIEVNNYRKDSFSTIADNYGSKNAGRYRYTLNSSMFNLENKANHLAISGSISNKNQHNYAMQYEENIGSSGSKAGVYISKSDYELGNKYASIGTVGNSNEIGVNGSTPLIKSSRSNLSVVYGFVYRNITDELRAYSYKAKKHSYSLYAGFSGNELTTKDSLFYDLTLTSGKLIPDDIHIGPIPLDISTKGNYTKGVLGLAYTHRVSPVLNFMIRGQLQQAANNLDSSEQFYLGGAHGVRAYPQGEGSGDEGYQATAELIYTTKIPGLSLATFIDTGHVKYNKNSDMPGGMTLKGWGLSAIYRDAGGLWGRIDYARRIGLAKDSTEDAKSKQRTWFTIGKNW